MMLSAKASVFEPAPPMILKATASVFEPAKQTSKNPIIPAQRQSITYVSQIELADFNRLKLDDDEDKKRYLRRQRQTNGLMARERMKLLKRERWWLVQSEGKSQPVLNKRELRQKSYVEDLGFKREPIRQPCGPFRNGGRVENFASRKERRREVSREISIWDNGCSEMVHPEIELELEHTSASTQVFETNDTAPDLAVVRDVQRESNIPSFKRSMVNEESQTSADFIQQYCGLDPSSKIAPQKQPDPYEEILDKLIALPDPRMINSMMFYLAELNPNGNRSDRSIHGLTHQSSSFPTALRPVQRPQDLTTLWHPQPQRHRVSPLPPNLDTNPVTDPREAEALRRLMANNSGRIRASFTPAQMPMI